MVLAAVFCVAALPVWSDARADARKKEQFGDRVGAIALYKKWLDENIRHRDSAGVVEHAASLHQNTTEALDFLSEYAEHLDGTASAALYARMAGLESLLGRLSEAADHYERAAFVGGADSAQWLLEAAVLRFSMGQYGRARTIALRLTWDAVVQRDAAAALAALARARDGEAKKAMDEILLHEEKHRPVASPEFWLAVQAIAEVIGDAEKRDWAVRSLAENFPSSAALYLARGQLAPWISPGRLMKTRQFPSGSPVQAGAFRSREGAVSLRFRLEEEGFTAWLEESRGMWKVLVYNADGSAAAGLVERGFLP